MLRRRVVRRRLSRRADNIGLHTKGSAFGSCPGAHAVLADPDNVLGKMSYKMTKAKMFAAIDRVWLDFVQGETAQHMKDRLNKWRKKQPVKLGILPGKAVRIIDHVAVGQVAAPCATHTPYEIVSRLIMNQEKTISSLRCGCGLWRKYPRRRTPTTWHG